MPTGGFFQIGQDGSIAPIGFLKVDKTLFGLMTAPDSRSIMATIDPFYSASIGRSGRVFVYLQPACGLRLGHQRWTIAEVNNDGYLSGRDDGFTAGIPRQCVLKASTHCRSRWTAKAWQGGAPLLGAIGEGNTFSMFSGLPNGSDSDHAGDGRSGGRRDDSLSTYPLSTRARFMCLSARAIAGRQCRLDRRNLAVELHGAGAQEAGAFPRRGPYSGPARRGRTQGLDVEAVGTGSR